MATHVILFVALLTVVSASILNHPIDACTVKNRKPLSVMFVCDYSLSMKGVRIQHLKEAIHGILDDHLIPGTDFAAFVPFCDKSIKEIGFTSNFTEIAQHVDNTALQWGTAFDPPLRSVTKLYNDALSSGTLSKSYSRVVIFLTDGEASYTPSSKNGPINDVAELGVVVNAVGVDLTAKRQEEVGLRLGDMANATSGMLFMNVTAMDLGDVFSHIVENSILASVFAVLSCVILACALIALLALLLYMTVSYLVGKIGKFPKAWTAAGKREGFISSGRRQALAGNSPGAKKEASVEVGHYIRGGTSLTQYRKTDVKFDDSSGWVPPSAPGRRVLWESVYIDRGIVCTFAWLWYFLWHLPKTFLQKMCCAKKTRRGYDEII